MRKGFFLSESEKNRISSLYDNNKNFVILEQSEVPDTSTVEKFQTFLDKKFRDKGEQYGWATGSTNNLYFVDRDPKKGFGRFGKNTKYYWNSDYGKEFRKSKEQAPPKKTEVSVTNSDDDGWHYQVSPGNGSDSKTKEEIIKLFTGGTISADTLIFHNTITNSNWLPINKVNTFKSLTPPTHTGKVNLNFGEKRDDLPVQYNNQPVTVTVKK